MRFRKSVKLGGVKFNLSKSGIGVSAGVKGLRVGISQNKGSYYSYGIPGTGLYNIKYQGKEKINSILINDSSCYCNEANSIPPELTNRVGCLWSIFTSFFLLSLFPLGICSLIGQILWFNLFYKNSNKHKALTLFNDAKNKIANKHFSHAIENLNSIKEMFPTISNINNMILECYLAEEDYKGALEHIKSYCSSTDDELQAIDIAYKAQEYQTVIDYSQNLPDQLKELIYIITIVGASYYKLEKYEIALEVLLKGPTRKRKMDSINCRFRYFLGLTYEALEENKKAVQQYNKILAYDEKYEDVKERIGKIQQ